MTDRKRETPLTPAKMSFSTLRTLKTRINQNLSWRSAPSGMPNTQALPGGIFARLLSVKFPQHPGRHAHSTNCQSLKVKVLEREARAREREGSRGGVDVVATVCEYIADYLCFTQRCVCVCVFNPNSLFTPPPPPSPFGKCKFVFDACRSNSVL